MIVRIKIEPVCGADVFFKLTRPFFLRTSSKLLEGTLVMTFFFLVLTSETAPPLQIPCYANAKSHGGLGLKLPTTEQFL